MTLSTRPITLDETNQRHRIERVLLGLAGAFLFVNFGALFFLRASSWIHWVHWSVWVVSAGVGHWVLNRYLPRRDPLLFPLMMFLSGWGLVIIDRLTPFFADRQTLWFMLSVGVMLFTATTPYLLRWLRRYRYVLLSVGLLLLVATILFGRNPSGMVGAPGLWLGFAGIFFQPSEALKVILVAFLASYLAEQYPALRTLNASHLAGQLWLSPRILGPILLMWGLCVVVLVWQRDLGATALFFIVFLLLLYVASGQWLILASGFSLLLVAGGVAYRLFAVVRLRVDIWLNPWLEADGRAYQIVQSLMAFSSGGVFGQGVGQGSPSYIPVVHSDFVFSALAEEWGLLGVVALIASLVIFLVRGFRVVVQHQERPFYALLAVGFVLVIGIQSLMILGGVLKLFPLTGVTLPFVSYGGSSLLMTFIMSSVLLRLSDGAT